MVTWLRRMLTPLGDETDDDAVNQVRLKVRGVWKTAQVMQKSAFPNMVIIMRDPAHIRISCRDPRHDAHAVRPVVRPPARAAEGIPEFQHLARAAQGLPETNLEGRRAT